MPDITDRTMLTSADEVRDATMLYLNDFCDRIQSHLTSIWDVQLQLDENCAPFRGGGNIRPIQCKAAVSTLEETRTRLQCFCQIFRADMYRLPIAFTILRYRSLSPVDLADEQASQLIDLIEDFRVDCMTSSPHVFQQRKKISSAFDQLLSHLYHMPLQFERIEGEAQHLTLELILRHKEISPGFHHDYFP